MPVPPEAPPLAGRGQLSLLVLDGSFARVHYALVLASAAAAVGRPVLLFLTLQATHAVVRGTPSHPGWHALLPPAGASSAAAADAAYRASGVAGFDELIDALGQLGARFQVCEMGLRTLGLDQSALRSDIATTVTGAVSFLAEADNAGTVIAI